MAAAATLNDRTLNMFFVGEESSFSAPIRQNRQTDESEGQNTRGGCYPEGQESGDIHSLSILMISSFLPVV